MKMGSFSSGTRKPDKGLIRAARRSAEDMRAERAAMVKRRAPLAVIEALDRRIKDAERIAKEESSWMESSDT